MNLCYNSVIMNLSEKNQLFNELAIVMNTVDVEVAKKFYYDFVKFVVSQTKKNGVLQLPNFGTFRIGSQKSRMGYMPRTGEMKWVQGTLSLRFKVNYKLRAYLNERV